MSRYSQRRCLGALAFVSSLVAGCGGLATKPATIAVRVVDAVPHTGTADFNIAGSTFVSRTTFTGVTTYGYVAEGPSSIIGYVGGTNTILVPALNTTLATGAVYTIVAAGVPGDPTTTPTFFPFRDDNTLPPPNSIRLRVINASPDAGPVDFSMSGQVKASNVPYGQTSGYITVNAGSYNLSFQATGASTVIASKNALTLTAGHVFTVVLGGQASRNSTSIIAQADI